MFMYSVPLQTCTSFSFNCFAHTCTPFLFNGHSCVLTISAFTDSFSVEQSQEEKRGCCTEEASREGKSYSMEGMMNRCGQ